MVGRGVEIRDGVKVGKGALIGNGVRLGKGVVVPDFARVGRERYLPDDGDEEDDDHVGEEETGTLVPYCWTETLLMGFSYTA